MPRALDLRIELLHVTPLVWRDLRVPAELRLDDLHHAIQIVMGWADHHLYAFEIAGREFGPRPEIDDDNPEGLGAWADEASRVSVARALAESGGVVQYRYDFGDDWELTVRVVGEQVSGRGAITCLAGERAGPPEDCGGPVAYQRIVDTLATEGRRGLDRELRDWLPKRFDPSEFDLIGVNAQLAAAFRPPATPDLPAGPDAGDDKQRLAHLTLAVLWLGSRPTRRQDMREAPKTLKFEILDALQEAGLIETDPSRKTVLLTHEGVARAESLVKRLEPLLPVPRREDDGSVT